MTNTKKIVKAKIKTREEVKVREKDIHINWNFKKYPISFWVEFLEIVENIEYSRKCNNVWEWIIRRDTIHGHKVMDLEITEDKKRQLIQDKQKKHFSKRDIEGITKRWSNMKKGITDIRGCDLVYALEKEKLILIISKDKATERRHPNNPENHWFTVQVLNFSRK